MAWVLLKYFLFLSINFFLSLNICMEGGHKKKYVWDSFDNENSLPPKGLGLSKGFRVKVLTMDSVLHTFYKQRVSMVLHKV